MVLQPPELFILEVFVTALIEFVFCFHMGQFRFALWVVRDRLGHPTPCSDLTLRQLSMDSKSGTVCPLT